MQIRFLLFFVDSTSGLFLLKCKLTKYLFEIANKNLNERQLANKLKIFKVLITSTPYFSCGTPKLLQNDTEYPYN